jgi:hypothetical protein
MKYLAYSNTFMVDKLLSQLCYTVIELSFQGFQKLLGVGLPSPHPSFRPYIVVKLFGGLTFVVR